MAKKAAKGGKKKKPAKTPIQAYDLETINKNDLKKYIASLEKELALMRQDCAFHSGNKDRVMEFLYAKKDSLLCLKQESVVKNTVMDDHIELLRTFPKKKNEKTIIDDREEIRHMMKKSFDDFVTTKCSEIDHFETELALKRRIADQHKRLEYDQFLYEMTLMDANQRNQNIVAELEVKNNKTIEKKLLENVDEILKLNQKFATNKIEMLTSIWEADDHTETTKSFVGEIKQMQDFFHEISSNSAERIKMLRDKLSSLMRESNKVELNLKQTRAENTKLKSSWKPAGFMPSKMTAPFSSFLDTKKNFESEKKLVTLQYRNDILARYLHMINENLKALKKQFTSSLRNVYQKADFRTLLIEEQVKSMLRDESSETEDSVRCDVKPNVICEPPKKETKIQDTDRTVNVLNLNFENSDTLFVPPVYHEFWNPSVKYLRK